MAYTRAWNEALPAGSEAANTLDDIIRNLKVDLRERLNDIINDFTTDPITSLFGCSLNNAAATQSIPNNAATVVTYSAEAFDLGSLHDNAVNTSRITIPTKGNRGIWRFHAHAGFAANATGLRSIAITKNGAGIVGAASQSTPVNGTDIITLDVTILVSGASLVVGDFFEMTAFQNSGGALNIGGAAFPHVFEAQMIL